MIDLLHNVESLAGNGLGDGGQGSRNVLVDHGETNRLLRSVVQLCIGEVDTVHDGAVLQVISDGVGGHGSGGILGLLGGGTQVGQDDAVFVVPEQVLGEVRHVFSVAAVQEFLHGIRADEFATGKVQQDGVGAEVFDDVLSDDSVGSILSLDVRDVDGDVIGTRNGGRDGIDEVHVAGQFHGGLDAETGIVSLDLHSQALGIAGGHGSDVSQSDHGEGLSLDLLSTEHGLVLFDSLAGQSLCPEVLHVVDSIHDFTGSQQHTAQDQFLDGVGVGTGGVEDGNSQFCHARDRNVVGTGTASRNGSHGLGDIVLLELVGSQQDCVGVGRIPASDVVLVLVEARQTNGRNLVEGLDLVFSLLVVIDVAVCLPGSSSVFEFDLGGHSSESCSAAEHEFVGDGGAVSDELVHGKSGGNHDAIVLDCGI
mmetsp:Transcript_23969/g.56496  ORF Transcript_23969/g.56496 Transcript_23969/m.56496 type:complete len:423 (+) Transcript_23969:366-1634(+)